MTAPQPSPKVPLDQWRGDFGHAYIERNQPKPEVVRQAVRVFHRIFDAASLRPTVNSVLEVGANVGINLRGLRAAFGPDLALSAVEPNPSAARVLREDRELGLETVVETHAGRLPFPDKSFDLVFTNGVLIHVPPADLPDAMREIARVAKRHVLCSEYFAVAPTEVPYRGQGGLLWKRDFGRAYLDTCPALRTRAYGFLWRHEFPDFDDLNWWVFDKESP